MGLVRLAGARRSCAGASATGCAGATSMIGLTERAEQYEQRGYTPLQSALGHREVPGVRHAVRVARQDARLGDGTRLPHRRRGAAARPGARRCRRSARCRPRIFTTPLRLEDRDDLRAALDRLRPTGATSWWARSTATRSLRPTRPTARSARSAAGTPPEIAEPDREHRWRRALHRAVARVRARRAADGRRRLPAARGLRRAARAPRAGAAASRRAAERRRDARGVARRACSPPRQRTSCARTTSTARRDRRGGAPHRGRRAGCRPPDRRRRLRALARGVGSAPLWGLRGVALSPRPRLALLDLRPRAAP